MDNIFISSLQSIGERAFAGAFTESESNDLDLVGASGLRTIGKDAFRACNTLTKLTLPVNLSQIGEGAFSECYNLAGTLDLPESLLRNVLISSALIPFCETKRIDLYLSIFEKSMNEASVPGLFSSI